MKRLLNFVLTAFVCAAAYCADVEFSAKSAATEIRAGNIFGVSFEFSIKDGVHIYSPDSKFGVPTTVDISLPQGYEILSQKWSKPQSFKDGDISYQGYKKSAALDVEIRAPKKIEKTSREKIAANAKWLACSDLCVPESASTEVFFGQIESVSSKKIGGGSNSAVSDAQSGAEKTALLAVLAMAFLGGAILNLMPCVFPVIGIKIVSFANAAGGARTKMLLGSAFYTLGIVASFATLAVVLLILRAAGESAGWGFQMQNPVFTAAMTLLFFAMAMSFAGAFEIGAGFAGGVSERGGKNEYASAFMSGVLAVLVASPCTAPFMGTALGAALATDISAAETLSVFIFLGLGMAAPYVVLSAVPALARAMPKPGGWMEILKQILSIPLFATVIWLVWLFSKQTGDIVKILSSLLILAAGLRVYGMYSLPHFSKTTRRAALAAAVFSAGAAMLLAASGAESEPQSAESDNSWSAEKLAKIRADGRAVYVDFTASWCLTCQFNKRVIDSKKIQKLLKEKNIAFLVGDWTNKNPEIAKELEKFGRAGVPLNLLYPPKGEPLVLPAVLTDSAVIDAVDKIK